MIINNLIFPFDYIILIILILIIIFSFWKGLIRSILSLLTWIGSILITIYTYEIFSNFLSKQLSDLSFFQKKDYITNFISIGISIPIIFIISLFFLKRIRNILSSDLDKKILGVIFDKFFGFIYGIIFSYIILSAFIIILNRFNFNSINFWLDKNSYIIAQINDFNDEYIYFLDTINKINIKDIK